MCAEGNLRFCFRCLQHVDLPLTSYSFVLIVLTAVGTMGICECMYRTFDIKSYIIIRLLVHPVEEQQHQDSGYCGRKNFPMSRHLCWILGELLRPPLLYQCQERCLYALYLADKVRMCKTASVACRAPCFYCIFMPVHMGRCFLFNMLVCMWIILIWVWVSYPGS